MPPQIERLVSFYMSPDRASVRMEASEENTPKISHAYINVDEAAKETVLLDLLTVEIRMAASSSVIPKMWWMRSKSI
ncbi:MAG: hypothetical protein U5K84_12305 [Alkalibacterium sp.]|nr:hypothetical protein [Alkalibacterium sp.]